MKKIIQYLLETRKHQQQYRRGMFGLAHVNSSFDIWFLVANYFCFVLVVRVAVIAKPAHDFNKQLHEFYFWKWTFLCRGLFFVSRTRFAGVTNIDFFPSLIRYEIISFPLSAILCVCHFGLYVFKRPFACIRLFFCFLFLSIHNSALTVATQYCSTYVIENNVSLADNQNAMK